ncbi:hypothetical protein [Streptomyces sp. NPDC005805]|uniref:hypothetical protein n=1 Tax=Streptomyces sp. NPDC005805 TaxID=3157068 RepID=UPI0033E833E8
MSWTVPETIKLTMVHQMEFSQEPGLTRGRYRETSCLVGRPAQGEARVILECGHCKRQGVFVVQDLETTKRLRRAPVTRSLITAVVLLAVVASFWIIGFGGGSILFQVLAIPASIILLPLAVFFAASPSSNIGVTVPEFVSFAGRTSRKGLTYTTRGTHHRAGLSCGGQARAAG